MRRGYTNVRWPSVAFALAALSLISATSTTTYAQQIGQCSPRLPDEDCPSPILLDPISIWDGCHPRVGVDINQKSFNRTPDKDCWLRAIRDNAIAGWNAAYNAIYHEPIFHEVSGNNNDYQVQFHFVDLDKYAKKGCKGYYGCAVKYYPEKPVVRCCGKMYVLGRVKIYFPDRYNEHGQRVHACIDTCAEQVSIKRVVVHELGHGIALADHNKPGGPDSVMNYGKCPTWPTAVDGQAVKCSYEPYRRCACR